MGEIGAERISHPSDRGWTPGHQADVQHRRWIAQQIGLIVCSKCHGHLIWTGFCDSGPCRKCGARGAYRPHWWRFDLPKPPTFYEDRFEQWWRDQRNNLPNKGNSDVR